MNNKYLEYFLWWSLYPYLMIEVIYFGISLLFFYFDRHIFQQEQTWSSYKLQKPQTGLWEKYSRAPRLVLTVHVIGSFGLMTTFSFLSAYRDMPMTGYPEWHTIPLHFGVYLVVEELMFYYGHKILHIPFLFKHIHSWHHEWVAPVAITATYCHPIEHIFVNVMPLLMGPFLCRSHISVAWFWWTLGSVNSIFVHSGYSWGALSATKHDRHHQIPSCNFGVLGVLDYLHRTRYEDVLAARQLKSNNQPNRQTLQVIDAGEERGDKKHTTKGMKSQTHNKDQ